MKMKEVRYSVPVVKQGAADCVQNSFAIAMQGLAFKDITAKSIIEEIPVNARPDGSLWGTSPAAVATYLLNNYPIDIHLLISDAVIFDTTWIEDSSQQLIRHLEDYIARIDEVPETNITKDNIELYAHDYLSFLKSGGTVAIGSVTSHAMKEQLQNGPLVITVGAQHYYDKKFGRFYFDENGKMIQDPVKGRASTHNMTVSGFDKNGFFISDPDGNEAHHSFEHIVTSIAAAQIESDNFAYCLSKK